MDLKILTDEELKALHKDTVVNISKSNNLQMGMKILLNAGYGALANRHFLYFLIENAEAITTTGQVVNRWTSYRINKLFNTLIGNDVPKDYIIYGDTDSTFVGASDIVKTLGIEDQSKVEITQKLDEFIKTVVDPEIQNYTNELADYFNNVENRMVWERETISDACILVHKKRYAMSVIDSEGVHYYNEPKYKITGLESIKSSTPEWAREPLKKCYILALKNNKKELQQYVKEVRKSIATMDVSDLAIPSGINGVEKYSTHDDYYIKGTPMHVRAAINHNRLVGKLGLTYIDRIGSGGNIKFLFLKKPNPIGDDVFGFVSYLHKEFGLEGYVDMNRIFTRGFEAPLQKFLDSIRWTTEEVITLF